MVANSQRWHIKNMANARTKMKGGINFSFLENLSTNLYATFQKCTLHTCKVLYCATVFMKGGVCFMPPYTTFTPPFNSFSALKYSWDSIFMPPYKQKPYHSALQADSQAISGIQGGVKHSCFVLKGGVKGVVKKYATFHFEQEVLAWQF
jgi:hypothetical protein